MKLYHCSPAPGLTVLKPSVSFGKPKQVCLAGIVPMALMYGAKHFEYTYGYRDGNIYFEEFFPNALEEIYRGRAASLYTCLLREDMKATECPNEYVTPNEVPVEGETVIPDVYEALMEQVHQGALKVVRWANTSAERREWVIKVEMMTIAEQNMLAHPDTPFARYMREKYPESWELAQSEADNH